MFEFTPLEIALFICFSFLLFQYLLGVFVFLKKENAISTAIRTMEKMQDYNTELFQKLLKEEKLTMALANQVKDYRKTHGSGGVDTIAGLNNE